MLLKLDIIGSVLIPLQTNSDFGAAENLFLFTTPVCLFPPLRSKMLKIKGERVSFLLTFLLMNL